MEELIQEAREAGVENEEQFEAFVELKQQYPDRAKAIFDRAKSYHYGDFPFSTSVGGAIIDELEDAGELDDWDEFDDDEYDDRDEDDRDEDDWWDEFAKIMTTNVS